MAVVPGLRPGDVRPVAPGLEVDDDGRPGGESGLEVGEGEAFAELRREAEFAGDPDDVEGMSAGLGGRAETRRQPVFPLGRSPKARTAWRAAAPQV